MDEGQPAVIEGRARSLHRPVTRSSPAPSIGSPMNATLAQPKGQRIRSGGGYFAEPHTQAPPSGPLAAWAELVLSASQVPQPPFTPGFSPRTAQVPERRLGPHVQHQLALTEDELADTKVDTKVGSGPHLQAGYSPGAAHHPDFSSEPETQGQPHLRADMPAQTGRQCHICHAPLLHQQLANTPARRRPQLQVTAEIYLQHGARPVANLQQQLAEVPADVPTHLQARHSKLTQQPGMRPEAQLAGVLGHVQPFPHPSAHASLRHQHAHASAHRSPSLPAGKGTPLQPQRTGKQVSSHAVPEFEPPMYICSPGLLQPPVQHQPLLHLPASRPGPMQHQSPQDQGFLHETAETQLPILTTDPGQQDPVCQSYLHEASELQQSLQQDIDLSCLLAEWAEDLARAASFPDHHMQPPGQLPEVELQAKPLQQQQRVADEQLPGLFDGGPGTSTWQEIVSNQAVREAEAVMRRGQQADLSTRGEPYILLAGMRRAAPAESLLVSISNMTRTSSQHVLGLPI